jgi:hypothetical protein
MIQKKQEQALTCSCFFCVTQTPYLSVFQQEIILSETYAQIHPFGLLIARNKTPA